MKLLKFGNRAIAVYDKDGNLKLISDKIPMYLSELINDTEYITKFVDDLQNYYDKKQVNDLITNVSHLKLEVVHILPTENINTTTIYLLPNGEDYDEYIYINNKWELIGTTKIDLSNYYTKEELNQILANFKPTGESSPILYTLPLGEASWLRIAKAKDTSKIASGIFTFNSYGIKEDGSKDTLNAVTFSVNSGINRVKQVYGDVLPLSVSPEMSGSSSSNGSVDTPSSASVVEEDIPSVVSEDEILAVSSDVPSSSVGGSGSGSANSFGLTTVTVEEYEQEIYVCGLVSFPNVEYYKAFEVELILENNSNYEPLEIFEKVDFTMVDSKGQMPVLEGFTFEKDKMYNFILKGKIKDLYDSSNNDATLGVHINHIDEETGEMVPFKVADMRYVEDTEYGYGMIWKANFLNVEKFDPNVSKPYLYFLSNIYDIDYSSQGDIIDGKIDVISAIKDGLDEINYILCEYRFMLDDHRVNYGKAKIFFNNKTKVKISKVYGDYEGECFLNDVKINLDEYVEVDIEKDTFVIIPEEGAEYLGYTCYIYLGDYDYELSMPFAPTETMTVENYEIIDNNPYNISLMVEETVKHNIIDKYNMHSIYKQIDKLEDDIEEVKTDIKKLASEGQTNPCIYKIEKIFSSYFEAFNTGSASSNLEIIKVVLGILKENSYVYANSNYTNVFISLLWSFNNNRANFLVSIESSLNTQSNTKIIYLRNLEEATYNIYRFSKEVSLEDGYIEGEWTDDDLIKVAQTPPKTLMQLNKVYTEYDEIGINNFTNNVDLIKFLLTVFQTYDTSYYRNKIINIMLTAYLKYNNNKCNLLVTFFHDESITSDINISFRKIGEDDDINNVYKFSKPVFLGNGYIEGDWSEDDLIISNENDAMKSYVDEAISNLSTLNLQVVQSLPTENISTTTIYLVPVSTTETNIYEEYIYVNDKWELIGTTKVDLTDYAKKTELFSKDYNDLINKPTMPSEFITAIPYDDEIGNGLYQLFYYMFTHVDEFYPKYGSSVLRDRNILFNNKIYYASFVDIVNLLPDQTYFSAKAKIVQLKVDKDYTPSVGYSYHSIVSSYTFGWSGSNYPTSIEQLLANEITEEHFYLDQLADKEYVDNAVSNAITKVLNEEV